MRSNEAIQWEKTLKNVFDGIDRELEAEYRSRWSLHPSRPDHGETSNPETDGLFNVGASFSAGYGSKHGPGYTVDIRISTMEKVADPVRSEIKQKVFKALQTRLPAAFPGKDLQVSEENGHIRIHGDLSLDD